MLFFLFFFPQTKAIEHSEQVGSLACQLVWGWMSRTRQYTDAVCNAVALWHDWISMSKILAHMHMNWQIAMMTRTNSNDTLDFSLHTQLLCVPHEQKMYPAISIIQQLWAECWTGFALLHKKVKAKEASNKIPTKNTPKECCTDLTVLKKHSPVPVIPIKSCGTNQIIAYRVTAPIW